MEWQLGFTSYWLPTIDITTIDYWLMTPDQGLFTTDYWLTTSGYWLPLSTVYRIPASTFKNEDGHKRLRAPSTEDATNLYPPRPSPPPPPKQKQKMCFPSHSALTFFSTRRDDDGNKNFCSSFCLIKFQLCEQSFPSHLCPRFHFCCRFNSVWNRTRAFYH